MVNQTVDKAMPNYVLGVDPGTTESASCLIDTRTGTIEHYCKVPNEEALECVSVVNGQDQTALFIEMFASYGMPVGRDVFTTCLWIGQLYREWDRRVDKWGKPALVYRKDVVLHHCHSRRAKDANIRRAMLDRFGEQGTKKAPGPTYGISKDVWSALAIAAYGVDTLRGVTP